MIQPDLDETFASPDVNYFTIDGYNGHQLDQHLCFLLQDKLIEGKDHAFAGIWFDRLTQAGMDFLNKTIR